MARLKKEAITSKKVRNPYGSNPIGVKAGPYLFLSGLMAFHPDRPSIVSSYTDLPDEHIPYAFNQIAPDSREAPGVVQSWRIFQQLKTLMEEQGSNIDETLWLWYSWLNMRDLPAQTRVRNNFFTGTAPAATAFEISGFPIREAVNHIGAIGVVPVDGEWPVRREILGSPKFDQLVVGNYVMATRAGDLAFFAGMIGVDMERRIVFHSFEEAGVECPIDFGSPVAQRRREPVAVQAWAIYDQYQKILAEHGCTMEHIVKQVVYLRDVSDIPIVEDVARHFFGDSAPATTILQIKQLAVPTYLIEIEAFALVPGDPAASARPQSIPSANGIEPWGRHALATSGGDFIFLSGLMADVPGPHKMVRGYDDLEAEGRKLATGSLVSDHWEAPIVAQAWTVYEKARRVLEAQGSSMDNVVKTTVLLKDMRQLPAVEKVAKKFFPENPPATMILGVPDLPLPGSLVELDVIALA
ncbi:MAG: Rid family hydrolase [Nitrospinota bacterium]